MLVIVQTDLWVFAVVLVLIALDYVTGVVKAVCTGTFMSSVMRAGLFHKFAYIVLIVLCEVLVVAGEVVDLGVLSSGVVTSGVAAWICITEVTSTVENLIVINPEIANNPLAQRFAVVETVDDEPENDKED